MISVRLFSGISEIFKGGMESLEILRYEDPKAESYVYQSTYPLRSNDFSLCSKLLWIFFNISQRKVEALAYRFIQVSNYLWQHTSEAVCALYELAVILRSLQFSMLFCNDLCIVVPAEKFFFFYFTNYLHEITIQAPIGSSQSTPG
jgi:hypothetical protein